VVRLGRIDGWHAHLARALASTGHPPRPPKAVAWVVQYLDNDGYQVPPLVKKTLDSIQGLP
jgi:predicted CoA-binding protein